MTEKLHHATIKVEHAYSASVERVYQEFANPQARAKWSAPSNDALVYDESDFREGGRDVFRCGPANDLRFLGTTTYQAIVPNRHVISTETVAEGDTCLAVALNTLEFEPTGEGSHLTVTIQIVSFVGPEMIRAYESGNRAALHGLWLHLGEDSGASAL
jgi:uncharacterized protein YndB with AHSA1/START domain